MIKLMLIMSEEDVKLAIAEYAQKKMPGLYANGESTFVCKDIIVSMKCDDEEIGYDTMEARILFENK